MLQVATAMGTPKVLLEARYPNKAKDKWGGSPERSEGAASALPLTTGYRRAQIAKMLPTITTLWAHLDWADGVLLEALLAGPAPDTAVREYAHILGAEEIWLARMEQRPSRTTVWPDLPPGQLESLAGMVRQGYRGFLGGLEGPALERVVAYINTAGLSFENSMQDILLHVALHGQYHRGKVNLMLRQAGHPPAPTDYIAYVAAQPRRGPNQGVRDDEGSRAVAGRRLRLILMLFVVLIFLVSGSVGRGGR